MDAMQDIEHKGGASSGRKDRALTPQEELWCQAYADPESDTYGNATKSAVVAKYASPANSGWKLRKRPRIKTRLAEYYEEAAKSIGRVMTDLEAERMLAIAKGDISSAIRASELMGKRMGAFIERNVVTETDLQERRELDERQKIEAKRIARLLLQDTEYGSPKQLESPNAERTEVIGRQTDRLLESAPIMDVEPVSKDGLSE